MQSEKMPTVIECISADYSRALKTVIVWLSDLGRNHKRNIREDSFAPS
ncbi:MAG: hypothetical protein J6O88_12340 [Chryseobacterium sp.]|nr:hypothetical protein [Chryseobacterium sp.]MBO6185457.1 hypothetical protein [Chryseobacterium sp.]